ncbi:dihydrofolate reductase-like domain-containing protein [Paraphysoderma sedebokerense]|nr:dihydrofolate reductase-like domain-containing protein [Paraphysoderma sedebokerense]
MTIPHPTSSLLAVVVAATSTSHGLGIGKSGGLPWTLKHDMAFFKKVTSCVDFRSYFEEQHDRKSTNQPVKEPESAEMSVENGESGQKGQNVVVMGRKTWESIPLKFRPLKDRLNVVVSRNETFRREHHNPPSTLLFPSFTSSIEHISALSSSPSSPVKSIYIIGGGQIYTEALQSAQCKLVFLTDVKKKDGKEVDCDTYFPELEKDLWERVSHQDLEKIIGEKIQKEVEEGEWRYEFCLYRRL